LPRATFTEKAFPEDESVLTGAVDRSPGSGSVQFDYIHEKRFGARNQVELRVPVIFRDRAARGRGWTGGHVGDVSLALKRAVYHTASLTSASIVSVGGEVVLPTGDVASGTGAGTTVLVQFHAGVEVPLKSARGEREAFARVVLGRSFVPGGFGRTWTPMLEVMGAGELERGATRSYDVVPQLQFALNKRQHILGSVGTRIPIGDPARTRQFVFYLLWDWFDGGLRDGW
jgi:hypothetical protein